MSISTHVLDAAAGRPAAGVPVRLEHFFDSGWSLVATAVTDADGRVREWTSADGDDGPAWQSGTHRIVFDTAAISAFFPEVAITFTVADAAEHHHVPLLLSPFAYSTYRGS